ncbi:helix-turn-helix domain-containing protein [Acetobacter vaccinii]|uniref:Helix-turn-helix transcriptional regulator n=1 Tax=Acetobacter vaccinii TaxID=2592655 RepID=A0A5C1YNA3_9PROT|nr:AraC family transcriptional regulator [Acetobacter vaccinii]QEO17764.1 helix-turn-helix transcriptional regulator [Acetobacter vaccinii]
MPLLHRPPLQTASSALEQYLPGQKIIQATGDAWNDAQAQIFSRALQEEEILVPAVSDPLLVWVISGEAIIEERETAGAWERSEASPGSFFLTQTEAPYLMRWRPTTEYPFEVLHLYLGPDLINRTARSLGLNPNRCRMRDISGAQDPLISGVLGGLTTEIQSPEPANIVFVKGLLESLTIHLLRSYTKTDSIPYKATMHLPEWKLRKALDHIETHLTEPFNLNILASLCGMSRFHFSRSFHHTMGHSPSHWFIQRRIELAATQLRQTDMSILEIALSVGYESSSHFSQVFRKTKGISPRAYRKR